MRKLLWDCLIRADMNYRYWDHVMRRRLSWDRALRVAQILLTSGPAAILVLSTHKEWALWPSIAATVLSVVLFVSSTSRPTEKLATLRGSYYAAMIEYEHLWVRLESGVTDAEVFPLLEATRRQETKGMVDEPHFKYDEKFLAACQAAAEAARKP
jgi:hypothetical protein